MACKSLKEKACKSLKEKILLFVLCLSLIFSNQIQAHSGAFTAPHTHIEIIPLLIDLDGDLKYLHPTHSISLEIPFFASPHPNEQVEQRLRMMGLEAQIIHSTSWRFDHATLTITYVVILDALAVRQSGVKLQMSLVEPASIVHGSATRAPVDIPLKSVIFHALTHLSWLSLMDEHVQASLSEKWKKHLKRYVPEAFRFLGK